MSKDLKLNTPFPFSTYAGLCIETAVKSVAVEEFIHGQKRSESHKKNLATVQLNTKVESNKEHYQAEIELDLFFLAVTFARHRTIY